MLIIIVVILMVIGVAVVGSLYSNFLVFYSNFNETQNYNKAYYASISALERAELVLKTHLPGYEGSGGRITGNNQGKNDNRYTWKYDHQPNNFSYFSSGRNDTSIFREIRSLTTRIPALGNGDIDPLLQTGDSKDYNMMDYINAETFLLYYDNEHDPYKTGNTTKVNNNLSITGTIRRPKLLSDYFGEILTNNYQGIGNTAVVDRQIRGKYDNDNNNYTIYAKQDIKNSSIGNLDSAIRKNDINKGVNLNFSKLNNPIGDNNGLNTIISPKEQQIREKLKTNKLNIFLNDSSTKNNSIRLALLTVLKTNNNNTYPFLEYYLNFNTSVPDKYYTINAMGEYSDYQVNTIVHKPTTNNSVIGNFTVIL